MTIRTLAAVAAALGLAAAAPADDTKVPNPAFTTWAKFKPGTTTVMKSTLGTALKTEVTVTSKLLEVKGDKLVMESETVINAFGTETKNPAVKQDVPKEVTPAEADAGPEIDAKTGLPKGAVADGTEKLKIGGVEFECERFKYTQKIKLKVGEAESKGHVWVSDKVPGRLVKMTGKSEKGLLSMEITIEVTSVTIKE